MMMMMMMSRNFEIRCGVDFQVAEEEADGELHLQRNNINHDVRTTSSRYNFSNENKIASSSSDDSDSSGIDDSDDSDSSGIDDSDDSDSSGINESDDSDSSDSDSIDGCLFFVSTGNFFCLEEK